MVNEDIVLEVGISLEKLKQDANNMRKMLKASFSDFTAGKLVKTQQQIKKVSADFNALSKGNLGIPKDFSKKFTNVNADLQKLGNTVQMNVGKKFTKATRMATANLNKLSKVVKRDKMEFAGWAMSIMFLGMALRGMFDQIWKSSTKTFNDVMHSVDGTVTQFDFLKGSISYLGFVAGQALEPIAAFLYPIIDAIAEWISANPKLFSTLTAITGVLGTAFMVGGSGVLAINGFRELATILTGMGKSKFTLGGLATFLMTPVGAGVLAALAAVIAIAGLSWASFKKTPEAWESIKDSMGSIYTYWKNLLYR